MRLRKLFVAAIALLSSMTSLAQQMPMIPTDHNVKIGHLDNGLTYYIRHNAYPENAANFYIAQKVGSLQEEESQRGLAHLLEHLAFNGTEHFKDNDLQEYLQSVGVEYGRNLNANTSTDRTVYFITDVPTKRETIVDSCLLILRDWSHGITLTQEAIDNEREIVHNEYRVNMRGSTRMIEHSLPALYPGSKYGVRMPIGVMSIIDGCSVDELRAFYQKWYRPDNQAIIVVGDIDVDRVEEKIKNLFSDITVPKDAAKVIPELVPDNKNAIYVVDKDKEMSVDDILIYMKHDAIPEQEKSDMRYFTKIYTNYVISQMLDQRYAEKAYESDCPYLKAVASYEGYLVSKTKDAFAITCYAKQGRDIEAYEAVLAEAKRAADFGFTATEYARARENFMAEEEKAYSNRDKMKNGEFTTQYVDNFTDGEPIPSATQKYKAFKMLVPNLPLEVINQAIREYVSLNDSNFVVFAMLQEKDSVTYPTPASFAAATAKVRAEKLTAYVDDIKQTPLVAQLPKAGTIKKTTDNSLLGYKELLLSNGAKVILKHTDFKDDEVKFLAFANGGNSSATEANYREFLIIDEVAAASGLGGFSNSQLHKALAGKQVVCDLSVKEYEHDIEGSSTPKDLETLFQLIHLFATDINKDEKSFNNAINIYATVFANIGSSPQYVYEDSLNSTIYMHNKLYKMPTTDDFKTIDYGKCLSIIRQLYCSAKDFTFVIVGNYDEQSILPLVQTYIASIPNSGKSVTNTQVDKCKGEVSNVFSMKMQTPQNQVTEYWRSEPMPNTLRSQVATDIAGRILDMTYNRNIREKLSAAYSVGAEGSSEINADGTMCYAIKGTAKLNPAKSDEAIRYFFSGMNETISNLNTDDLNKVKEILLKKADVNATTNSYWIDVLASYLKYGIDTHTDYKGIVTATKGKDITDFLQNVILKSGNHAEILMKETE